MALTTAAIVACTAYLVAWDGFCGVMLEPLTFASFWEFTTTAQTNFIKLGCILAGLLVLPLSFLPSPRSRAGFISTLALHGLTAAFALFAAGVMIGFHLISLTDHH